MYLCEKLMENAKARIGASNFKKMSSMNTLELADLATVYDYNVLDDEPLLWYVTSMWSKYKQIYDFTPELADSLFESDSGSINSLSMILDRIPHRRFYCNCKIGRYNGFFICVDPEGIFVYLVNYTPLINKWVYCEFYIDPKCNVLEDIIKFNMRRYDKNDVVDKVTLNDIIPKIASLLLYLCSEGSDIKVITKDTVKKKYSNKKKDIPTTVNTVGEEVSYLIRRTKESKTVYTEYTAPGTGSRKCAHVRKAHWHTYYTGPRDNRVPVLKWLPPMIIHKEESLPTTINEID